MTPHFGVAVLEKDGTEIRKLKYKKKNGIVSEKTSETMRILLKSVVEEGSGKNGYIEGYSIGGKTATSQTLPRSANKYISSFIGFAPAEDPQVLGIVVTVTHRGFITEERLQLRFCAASMTMCFRISGLKKTDQWSIL